MIRGFPVFTKCAAHGRKEIRKKRKACMRIWEKQESATPYAAAVYAAVLVQKDKKEEARRLMEEVTEKTPEGSLAEGYCRTGQAGGGRRGRRLPGFPGGA